MKIINRFLQKEVQQLIRHFPVVGILGSRQVGKTTVAKDFIKNFSKSAIYLDLELPSDMVKLRDPELFLGQYQDKTVVIDEIQRMPELFPLLRSLIDQHRIPGRFVILGSASPELLRKSSESLAGRIIYVELEPFHIEEIPSISYKKIWLQGGYPEAALKDNKEIAFRWTQGFVQAFIERDLPALGLPSSPAQVRQLMQMLSSLQGGMLNFSLLSKSLGVSAPTVKNQIDYLEQAFLVRRLFPFHLNLKKRLVRSPKIYIRDTGLLHYFWGIDSWESLQGYYLLGNSFESFVIQQVISRLNDRIRPYFYRTQDGSEVDLVLVKGNNPVATLEIKYTNSPKLKKGNVLAIQDLKTEHNFIVTPSAYNFPYRENIQVCNVNSIWKLLSELDLIKK